MKSDGLTYCISIKSSKLQEFIVCSMRYIPYMLICFFCYFRKTRERELTACIQFPQDYPNSTLLVEIKSKFLTPALVKSINQICDQELKNYIGRKQVGYQY